MTFKPTWTSSTFLHYAGMLVVIGAVIALLEFLEGEHGNGLIGWSVLFLAVAFALAVVARGRGEAVLAGLLAVLTVIVFAAFAGSIFDALGFLPSDGEEGGPFVDGIDVGLYVLELIVLAAALVALRAFRFPLLALLASLVVWFFAVDVLGEIFGASQDANATAVLVVGLAYVLVGRALDGGAGSPSAFWVHLVAGLSVGGAVLWFLHSEDWHWGVVAGVALAYVGAARVLRRSSYAVLGAIGLTAVATYFIEKWFALSSLLPFAQAPPEDVEEWGRPLVYLALGAVLVLLGLLVEWRRSARRPGA